jgi:hypothetical protein
MDNQVIDKIKTKIETIMKGSEKTKFFSVGSLLFVLSAAQEKLQ